MKRILMAGFMMLCMGIGSHAQVTINSQLPAGGMLLKEQLWNLVLTNNSNDITEVKIQLNVQDLLIGQSVLNAASRYFIIGKGIKMITLKDLHPLQYNYVDADFSGNYLPCGTYSISYHVLANTTKGELPVADEVTRLTVAPMSPPMLAYPVHEAVLTDKYPQLSWTAPVPMQMFNPLLYDIKVSAIAEGQSAREAIEFNQPAYSNMNLSRPFDKFPSGFTALEEGKKYAWQVTARNGTNCISNSEIWTFSTGKDSIRQIVSGAPYIRISSSGTEVTVAHQGVVKMEFINTSSDSVAIFKIYKLSEKDAKKRKEIKFHLDIKPGSNFLSYDTYAKYRLEANTVYELTTVNSGGEQWFLKFTPVYHSK